MTLAQTEPSKIYYGAEVQVSDMQGPCPDGFHIPTKTEWNNVYSAGVSLGAWSSSGGANLKTYLKLPYAGIRNNGTISGQGSYGYCWCSNPVSGNRELWALNFYDGTITLDTSGYGIYACSIRPYKNTAVVPDSNWSVLKQGTGNAGIYHNSTLGLISISSDGTTRYTIADKNLGATTVYNSGDVLSEANCGKYYQKGNNYGFPFTGTVTTSSTQIDGSSYGPGNYYNSSTYITSSSYPYDWSTTANGNLRGGVTQGTYPGPAREVTAVYLGEDKVRPSTPAYEPVWDYVLNSTSYTGGLASYWYGLKIIPKVNCTLNKIRFVADANMNGWTLKITDSNFSATGTTYTVSGATGGVYTLPTPFQMTAGTTYAVGLQSSSGGYYYNYNPGYPLSGTNVTFKCGLNGYNNSEQNVIYNIRGVETTQTA